MELRRDGTINAHSFSHPWPADNKKKRGAFQIFPSSNLGVKT
jgi:hypothetical protein